MAMADQPEYNLSTAASGIARRLSPEIRSGRPVSEHTIRCSAAHVFRICLTINSNVG